MRRLFYLPALKVPTIRVRGAALNTPLQDGIPMRGYLCVSVHDAVTGARLRRFEIRNKTSEA